MRKFALLFDELDSKNSSNSKKQALVDYFATADEVHAAWVTYLFSGRKAAKLLTTTQLKEIVTTEVGFSTWLFQESYAHTGDLAETLHLLLPDGRNSDLSLVKLLAKTMPRLAKQSLEVRKKKVMQISRLLTGTARFLFFKLLTGGFRVGVSQSTLVQALEKHLQVDKSRISQKLLTNWLPRISFYADFKNQDEDLLAPVPFMLATALPTDKEIKLQDFQVEYKYDGIRAQLIVQEGKVLLWSRGGEPVNESFPELIDSEPYGDLDIHLDGEVVVFKKDKIQSFQALQKRLGRKKPSANLLKENPVCFIAYDLLKDGRIDYREEPLEKRRSQLCQLQLPPFIQTRETLELKSIEELKARFANLEAGVEGFMLKNRQGSYKGGRPAGQWYKWKKDPLEFDGVLLYAQSGHGRRAGLFTDYTLAVKDGDNLVPVAKAYSGLTDEELIEVDRYVKKNTVEKFGPVRSVKPELVFTIAFEGIGYSSRHKSGLAMRFPRILRWRKDKSMEDINTLESLKALVNEDA